MHRLNKFRIGFIFWLLFSQISWAQPTNNPYRTFYPNTPPHWTDTLPWNKVFGLWQFNGSNTDSLFTNAINSIADLGGGILYVPAGTYQFNQSLAMRSGVIIRGETPSITNATDAQFAPETKFIFPKYIFDTTNGGTPNNTAFKTIFSSGGRGHLGLVYIDINRASISFGPSKYKTVTLPSGQLTSWINEDYRNILVFGVRNNNVASPDAGVPNSKMRPWQRFCNRFVANIRVTGTENLIVANCRVNDYTTDNFSQPKYLAKIPGDTLYAPTENFGDTARFNYTDHYGIYVGRKGTPVWGAEPHEEPNLFTPGVEILDNYVLKTMRVGILCAGLGLKVYRNIVDDAPNSKNVTLHPSGISIQTNYSATYENRGIDWSGWNVNLLNNNVTVKRHRIRGSNYSSVDGEGILFQECCGGTTVNGASINYNTMAPVGGYIGIWKGRDLFNVSIKHNNLNGNDIFCTANTNGATYALNSVRIDSNSAVKGIAVNGTKGGTLSYVRGNTGIGTGKITYPCHVVLSGNSGFNIDPCTSVPTTYPFVTMVLPSTDTVVTNNTNSVLLRANVQSGLFDSLTFFQGITPIGKVPISAPELQYQLPTKNGEYYFYVRGNDLASSPITSNVVTVIRNHNFLSTFPTIKLVTPTADTSVAHQTIFGISYQITSGIADSIEVVFNNQVIAKQQANVGLVMVAIPNHLGTGFLFLRAKNNFGQKAESNTIKVTLTTPTLVQAPKQTSTNYFAYPNPAITETIVDCKTATQTENIQIFSPDGRLIAQYRSPNLPFIINTQKMLPGPKIVKITDNQGFTQFLRIITY